MKTGYKICKKCSYRSVQLEDGYYNVERPKETPFPQQVLCNKVIDYSANCTDIIGIIINNQTKLNRDFVPPPECPYLLEHTIVPKIKSPKGQGIK